MTAWIPDGEACLRQAIADIGLRTESSRLKRWTHRQVSHMATSPGLGHTTVEPGFQTPIDQDDVVRFPVDVVADQGFLASASTGRLLFDGDIYNDAASASANEAWSTTSQATAAYAVRYSLNSHNSSSRFGPLASTSQGARVSAP